MLQFARDPVGGPRVSVGLRNHPVARARGQLHLDGQAGATCAACVGAICREELIPSYPAVGGEAAAQRPPEPAGGLVALDHPAQTQRPAQPSLDRRDEGVPWGRGLAHGLGHRRHKRHVGGRRRGRLWRNRSGRQQRRGWRRRHSRSMAAGFGKGRGRGSGGGAGGEDVHHLRRVREGQGVQRHVRCPAEEQRAPQRQCERLGAAVSAGRRPGQTRCTRSRSLQCAPGCQMRSLIVRDRGDTRGGRQEAADALGLADQLVVPEPLGLGPLVSRPLVLPVCATGPCRPAGAAGAAAQHPPRPPESPARHLPLGQHGGGRVAGLGVRGLLVVLRDGQVVVEAAVGTALAPARRPKRAGGRRAGGGRGAGAGGAGPGHGLEARLVLAALCPDMPLQHLQLEPMCEQPCQGNV
eukprot:scaffold22074_cov90-Isochrysis_galbana.AAC.2